MNIQRCTRGAIFLSVGFALAVLTVSVLADEANQQITVRVAAPVGQQTASAQNGFCKVQLQCLGLTNDHNLSLILDEGDESSAQPVVDSEPSTKAPEDPKSIHCKLQNATLTVWLPWPDFQGTKTLKVVSAGKISNAVTVHLQQSWGIVPFPDFILPVVSAILAGLLFALPIIIVRRWGDLEVPGAGRSWLVSALFLDKETATYSLSKFQFYLWTAVSLVGYVYLVLSLSLQQGYFQFVDIPENLPGIILISGATTVTAQFATVARGPKGAGPQNPSYADFVTAGGVVMAERFQFFVWTLLGCIVFLYLVLSTPPSHLHGLPTIPERFLQLMGISALGYVGGKVARKPGPIIDEITPSLSKDATPVLTLAVKGRILSPDATFKLGYQTVDPNDPKKLSDQEQQVDLTLDRKDIKVVDVDQQTKPDLTAKALELTIRNHKPEWLIGKPTLTISNPDGQAATWPFPGYPQMFAVKVQGTTPFILLLEGRNLPVDSKFKIDTTDLDAAKLPLNNIEALQMDELWNPPRMARSLKLTIATPDPAWSRGQHKLVLTTPSGLVAEGTIIAG